VGHLHEFGALVSALTASKSGWQVFYFGPNPPIEEIAFAVKKLDTKVLALNLCHKIDNNNLMKELKKLLQNFCCRYLNAVSAILL